MRPHLPNFESKSFFSYSQSILLFLKKTALQNLRATQDDHWIFVHEANIKTAPKNSWTPKMYICVQPNDYWTVVANLITLSRTHHFTWKFCKNMKLMGRPDKIIIYAKNASDLKRIIRLVRPLLANAKFHRLFFASDSVQTKLEKKGNGIYVGADPNFLKQVSWRYYRWAIEQAIIKPNLKNGRVNSETKKALKILNINLKNQGPLTISPNKKNIQFIKKVWKEIAS